MNTPLRIADGKTLVMFVGPAERWRHHRHMVDALQLRLDCGTIVCHDQDEALTRLTSPDLPLPHVLLLVDYDYTWDSLSLIRRLRQMIRTALLPIVVLSTDSDPAIPERGPRALAAGATTFHVIPVSVEEILADIPRAVGT